MSIKAGELIHVGNTVLIDRLQTGGPGTVNIPEDTIYELGNYESVATIRDIPDLTFTMESLDVSSEVEALLLARDFATDAAGQEYRLANARPMDVLSQFKAGKNATSPYNVIGSAVLPFLNLETASYRFGLRDNATQNFTLRGDSVYYASGSAFVESAAGSGAAGQVIPFTQPPIPYRGDTVAGTRYALAVTLVNSGRRLSLGADYTETAPTTGATPTNGSVTITAAVPATETIRDVYQSTTVAAYPQASHAVASATRPAAIRGRDIEILVGGRTLTSRWSSVQSANVDYRVTLERDEEFSNPNVVSQDYDVPQVNGTINIKPRDFGELMTRIRQISGAPTGEIVGPMQSTPLPLDIVLHSPVDGSILKTLHIPDARFQLPGYQGRVQQKLTVDLNFTSDKGVLAVFKGARP